MRLQKLLRNLAIGTILVVPVASFNLPKALAGMQDFTAVNDTDLVIVELYVSPDDSNSWGRDRLGSNDLESGDQFVVEFNNDSSQCLWDIKAIYENGSYDETQKNLCEISTIRFWGHGGDNSASY